MFDAASVLQYVNMLESMLSEIGSHMKFPSYEHTKLETSLQYDYIKASLTRTEEECTRAVCFLQDPPIQWRRQSPNCEHAQVMLPTPIVNDFQYLISRIKTLLAICGEGKATLMSNYSIQDAKRSAREGKLVTQLTKATNRVTFIFLPISFVTSVFGMNFKQFGQGELSIWIWAVITVPLLLISIVIVEAGAWMIWKVKKLIKE